MKFDWPIKGIGKIPGIYISQFFGENFIDPNTGKPAYPPPGHPGIDIACPKGTFVGAAISRPVTFATNNYLVGGKNYGIYVQQEWTENGHTYLLNYGHLDSQMFGEIRSTNPVPVNAGDKIGEVDHTGFVVSSGGTGDHLHHGLWIDNVPTDIIPYMKILMHQIGWNDTEKGIYIPADSQARFAEIIAALPALADDFQFDSTEWNLGKRPWPPLHK